MRTHVIPRRGSTQTGIGGNAQHHVPPARRAGDPTGAHPTEVCRRGRRYIHVILRRALSDAVDLDLIQRNPADKAKPPAAGRRTLRETPKAWTRDDLARFLRLVAGDEDRFLALWRMIAYCMRRSEAIGLQWGDVDLDAGRLTIVRAITTASGEVFIDVPKTRSGARTIQLDRHTLEVLRSHRRRIAEERMMLGMGAMSAGDWIFADIHGSHLEPTSVSQRFVRECRRHGLPHIGVHGLLHVGDAGAREGSAPASRDGTPWPRRHQHHVGHLQPCDGTHGRRCSAVRR